MKKSGIVFIVICLLQITGTGITPLTAETVDALTSATAPAVHRNIPEGITLKVTGKVMKDYILDSRYLSTLSTVRVRTREVNVSGQVTGAYAHTGIPLYFLMDGIAPVKSREDAFDRPLDMIVTFVSKDGSRAHFSYGELTMCDDNDPVTLAYHREQVLPSKAPEKYTKNMLKEPLKGLRLICPGDRDTRRYLDDVVEIRLWVPATTNGLFPVLSRGKSCQGGQVHCILEGEKTAAAPEGIEKITISHWFRTGHGQGIKSERPETASGYRLDEFLIRYFGPGKTGDFYVFAGCDGYRSIFSWNEIFMTAKGKEMILITDRNGISGDKGITLGPVSDFFVDRNIWGLSVVEKVTAGE